VGRSHKNLAPNKWPISGTRATHLRNGDVFALGVDTSPNAVTTGVNARAHGGKNEAKSCERFLAHQRRFSVGANRSLRRTRNTDTVPLQELVAGASTAAGERRPRTAPAPTARTREERIVPRTRRAEAARAATIPVHCLAFLILAFFTYICRICYNKQAAQNNSLFVGLDLFLLLEWSFPLSLQLTMLYGRFLSSSSHQLQQNVPEIIKI
jgi:hypothetical protein